MAADAGGRECLIAPSAATVGAATLSTRAAPDRSPTSRRRRPRSPLRRSFFSIAACTDKIAGVVGAPWFCAPTARRWMSEVRMPRGCGGTSRFGGLVDCYQIVTGKLPYFPLPSFVTLFAFGGRGDLGEPVTNRGQTQHAAALLDRRGRRLLGHIAPLATVTSSTW